MIALIGKEKEINMKKILLSLLVIAFVQGVSAQNFHYKTSNSSYDGNMAGGTFTQTLKLAKNQNGDPITFVWETISVDTVLTGANASVAFGVCDNVSCYPNFVGNEYTMNPVSGAGSYGSFKLQCFSAVGDVRLTVKILVWDQANTGTADTITMEWSTPKIGVEELAQAAILEVFPNPASGVVNINYELESGEQAQFDLVNVLGATVFSKELSEMDGKFQLNLENLPQGVYFYVLKINQEAVISRRLVVE